MKKVVSVGLTFLLVLMIAFSCAENYSTVSDEELLQMIHLLYAELDARNYNDDNLMFEYKGLKIFYDRAYFNTINKTLVIEASAINESNQRVCVSADNYYINGWKVHSNVVVDLRSGQKQKLEIKIYEANKKAEINSIEDLKEIWSVYSTYDPDTNKYIEKGLEGQTIIIQQK